MQCCGMALFFEFPTNSEAEQVDVFDICSAGIPH